MKAMRWRHIIPKFRAASFSTGQSPVKKIAVVGCGQMGTGIAIVAAKHAGAEVVGLDAYPTSLERSKAFAADWAAKEALCCGWVLMVLVLQKTQFS